jgi:hypothetical protein
MAERDTSRDHRGKRGDEIRNIVIHDIFLPVIDDEERRYSDEQDSERPFEIPLPHTIILF